jgi:ribosomal protein S1
VVQGKVTRIVKFGLFVQIETGMEGLVHISELSPEQIKRPSDVAKIGDELIVRIIDIDFDKRRMAFSVKQVEFPETEEEKMEEIKNEEEKIEKPKSSKKADTKKAKEKEASEVEKENAEQKESKSTSPEFEDISQKEKKETIKKILSELKKEANLE